MGAETHLNPGSRWLTPLPLWSGILAGPIAWAFDLPASYALVKWACVEQSRAILQAVTLSSLALVCAGAAVSWRALQATANAWQAEDRQALERARFMAILGLASSALFALQILAGAIPHWVLDACR